jgi:hypothetical protein
VTKLEDADGENFDLGACLAAAASHDVGKLAFPDEILTGSRGELTLEEREALVEHVFIGCRAVAELGDEFEHAARILLFHHRWYDNLGSAQPSDYPESDLDGLVAPRGRSIPLESRILAVADSLDAMLSDRSYRPGLPLEVAREEVRRGSGNKFCPLVAKAALAVPDEVYKAISEHGRIQDEGELVLWFGDKRLTPVRLLALFETLRFIYLPTGSAIGRLAVRGVSATPGNPVEVVLRGETAEIERTFNLLRKRMEHQRRRRARTALAGQTDEATVYYLMDSVFAVPMRIRMTLSGQPPVFHGVP